MKIKKILSKNKFLKKKYREFYVKNQEKKQKKERNHRLNGKYKFIDRKRDSENLCIILAGYKKFLWDEVFYRIKNFAPQDMDVCIMSSGMYNDELAKICEMNNWSYVATKKNHVSLIQNITINLFKKAKYIYKLDEDVFITNNYFETLKKTLVSSEQTLPYHIGFVTPLIPINGFTYIKVLEKLNLLNEYETKFGKAFYDTTRNNKIISDETAVKYLWEKTSDLDKINDLLLKQDEEYFICPIRFSIGAILFRREIFEEMKMFSVSNTIGLGEDEEDLCCFCLNESKVVVSSANSIVGHLSFSPTNNKMCQLYQEGKILKRKTNEK